MKLRDIVSRIERITKTLPPTVEEIESALQDESPAFHAWLDALPVGDTAVLESYYSGWRDAMESDELRRADALIGASDDNLKEFMNRRLGPRWRETATRLSDSQLQSIIARIGAV